MMKKVDENTPTPPTGDRAAPSGKPHAEASSRTSEEELRQRVKAIEDERERLRNEVADLREKHLRARADYDNLAKRTQRESQDTLRFVRGGLLLRVASLVETLESLFHDLEKRLGPDAAGAKLVLEEAKRLLRDEGVREIPGKGQPFNYRHHQAVERLETSQHPEGTILEVVQRGYKLGEDVLRPALVKVAVPPKTAGGVAAEAPRKEL